MQEKAVTNRKERAALTKDKIYKSARELFAKQGFDTVNVDDIVKHAGVAKGSFYVHFESKDLLIASLINDYVKMVDTDYNSYIKSLPADMSTYDVILSLVGKIADTLSDEIGCENMKILYRIHLGSYLHTEALISYTRDLYTMFIDIINKGISKGEFHSDFKVDEVAKHFVIAYRGLVYEWCVRGNDFNLKEQALKHYKIMLAGIMK